MRYVKDLENGDVKDQRQIQLVESRCQGSINYTRQISLTILYYVYRYMYMYTNWKQQFHVYSKSTWIMSC